MQNLIEKAIKNSPAEEPWNGYYMVRALSMENLLNFIGVKSFGRVLDVGCGNAYNAYLLSGRSTEVIAADLYCENSQTHTVGLDKAKKLICNLKTDNIRLCSSSMEDISFKDNTFDVVYAANVLQYLKNKQPALNEIKRVLKKDGIAILVVPNFLERIYAFFQFYIYMAIKAFQVITDKCSKHNAKKTVATDNMTEKISNFKKNYKYFPWPGPHGAYANSAVELVRHLPTNWNREAKQCGFEIKKKFTTNFLPTPLLLTISVRLTSVMKLIFQPFVRVCGDKPIMKFLGNNYCLLIKK